MQLDLFTVRKAPKEPAIIYRFPLARRVDLIRSIATELRSRSYDDGKRFWTQHVQQMRRDLKQAGLSRSQIDAEIAAYSQSVRRQIYSTTPERMSK